MCVINMAFVFIVKDLVCLLDSLELDFGGGALFLGDFVRVVGQRSLFIIQSVLSISKVCRGNQYLAISLSDFLLARAAVDFEDLCSQKDHISLPPNHIT